MTTLTYPMIEKLSNERQHLYELAGNSYLTDEQRKRLDEITGRLPGLWDQYRRELAAARYEADRPARIERQKRAAIAAFADDSDLRRAA
jgi:hypothetical protein